LTEHTHLDRQRREPGLCPGCDADWAAQAARLEAARPAIAITKQLDQMADKKKSPTSLVRWCTAVQGRHGLEHACILGADHPGPHRCALCPDVHDWVKR
jgi:hypothetical protein